MIVLPAELLAVTLYSVASFFCVGVPEILPVSASMLTPSGRSGVIAYCVMVMPLGLEMVMGDMLRRPTSVMGVDGFTSWPWYM